MVFYSNEQVMQAFRLYSVLAMQGYGEKEQLHLYMSDDSIRSLVDQFAKQVLDIYNTCFKRFSIPRFK